MKILIAYDGSGNSRFLLDELKMSGLPQFAEVFIIAVSEIWLSPEIRQTKTNDPLDGDISDYFQKHSEQVERNLAETKDVLFEAAEKLHGYFPNWNITTEAVSGSAARQILLAASKLKPDLIVIGAQGLSWDNTERLGGVSNKVLAEAKTSVRIVRTNAAFNPQKLKIAVCFDGSSDSVEAVKTVASRHWKGKTKIRLMTVTDLLTALIPGRVFQVIPGLAEGRMAGEKKWVEQLAEETLQILIGAGLSAELKIYSGNPRIVLVNEIKEWSADMIFIGANSDKSQNYSLGSVASAAASRSVCTVEVVRGS